MGWYSKYMIWYDARTGKPIAPGEGEYGGPPSMDFYYCPDCDIARGMCWLTDRMVCDTCGLVLLVTH